MWTEAFEKLNNTEKEEFRRLVNYLMARSFVVRDVYDSKEKRMRIHPDFRFIERHLDLFREYLGYGGWSLHKDNSYGVIALASQYDYNRLRLAKFTTLVLYTLRLIFEEKREEISLNNEVVLRLHDLVQKMTALGILDRKPSYKDLGDALKVLERHNILHRKSGKADDPDCVMILYPTILFIIPNEKIAAVDALLQERASLEQDEKSQEGADGLDASDLDSNRLGLDASFSAILEEEATYDAEEVDDE